MATHKVSDENRADDGIGDRAKCLPCDDDGLEVIEFPEVVEAPSHCIRYT